MTHQMQPFFAALAQLLSRYKEEIAISLIVVLVEFGRLLYFGGKWRQTIGEMLICLVLIHVIRPQIPVLPMVFGYRLSAYDVAFVIGMTGVRGIRRAVEWAIKRYTGTKIRIE